MATENFVNTQNNPNMIDSLLVSKLKIVKIQIRDVDVIFTIQINAVYSQTLGGYKKKIKKVM